LQSNGRTAAERIASAALALAGIAFGAVSLTFPFGRDQGVFHYVGRELALRGAMPYRDAYDHKGPLLYVIHASLAVLTCDGMWAVRAAELGAVVAAGWLSSRVSRARSAGPAIFAASVFYYGYFPFQDTGNCEVWCATFALASLACIGWRRLDLRVASVIAGAFLGAAFLAKPPSMCFAPIVVAAQVVRLREDGGANASTPTLRAMPLALASLAAGGATVIGLVALWLHARGALGDAYDLLFVANRYFVVHGASARSIGGVARETYRAFDWFIPFSYVSPIVCGALVVRGIRKRDRSAALRYTLPLALTVAAYAAVAMQAKFFIYHYALLVAPFAVHASALYDDASRATAPHAVFRRAVAPLFVAIACGLTLGMTPHDIWLLRAKNAVRRATGAMSADELTASFNVPNVIDMENAARVGAWLRANTREDETVLVRGYEPEIYAFAHRRCEDRFFWTAALTDPTRAYKRDEWLGQDRASITERPPAWVVAFSSDLPKIDSATWFERLAYERRASFGAFVILQRAPSSSIASRVGRASD
jgi:hypothetical protein